MNKAGAAATPEASSAASRFIKSRREFPLSSMILMCFQCYNANLPKNYGKTSKNWKINAVQLQTEHRKGALGRKGQPCQGQEFRGKGNEPC